MAKQTYNGVLTKDTDWGGDINTGGLPASGQSVQNFIKDSLNSKIGVFYFDSSQNKYLCFADEESQKEYLETLDTSLVLGNFDAPFNYSAEINLLTPAENTVLLGSTGNKIEFDFATKNKSGAILSESVDCTITITRGAYKKTVKNRYAAFTTVSFLVDEYLEAGTTSFSISIVGVDTLAATAATVRYKAVSLSLTSGTSIGKIYNASSDSSVSVDFAVKGSGSKTVEWYLNGTQLELDKEVDYTNEESASRVKVIDISKFNLGRNILEFRVASTQNDEVYYSKVIHKEFAVINNTYSKNIALMAYESNEMGAALSLTQYEKYILSVAGYSPDGTNNMSVSVDGKILSNISTANGIQSDITITPKTSGSSSIIVTNGDDSTSTNVIITASSISVTELTDSLTFAFDAEGKTNNSNDRDVWSSGDFKANLTGFSFENDGWIDGGLVIKSGCKVEFVDTTPLSGKSLTSGKTIEIEFETASVKEDEEVLIDLISNGKGLKVTSTEASLTNGDTSVSTKFNSDSRQRVSFVINKSTVSEEKGLYYIYVNGELSGAEKYGTTDFTSLKNLTIEGSDNATLTIYNIRVYDKALTESQIINNYILYRSTVDEMLKVYNRNNIYEEGSSNFNMSALQSMCPVMIITGNIPALENTTDKNLQIKVDVEYTNVNYPHLNFTAKNAAMRPQGTSSMAYPKKNFRLYTKKYDDTVLTVNGSVVEDRLYSFKDGAQPVHTWCFKADFAESSGTHNTGIARLWNEAMKNTVIDGEYKLRTEAQKAAQANGYQYDVRTCVDGFPVMLFYKLKEDDNPIFIGKYNFNNDKSTESVFGFKGIDGFDNSKVECWEGKNNGSDLGNFITTDDWDNKWEEAFEARYPDGSEDTTALKRVCDWIVSTKGNVSKFSEEKYDYFDVYKLAAYYIYVMRFAAVDQLVKNTMMTTEDGEHWFFINYDNDTINGLTNDGDNRLPWNITRQTSVDGFTFAGGNSTLWNNCEEDEDFMAVVTKVDKALAQYGLTVDAALEMFNEEQAGSWCERIYNLDARYKYIDPYLSTTKTDNLYALQGSRSSHREYWLSRRFDMYDGEFLTGSFLDNVAIFNFSDNTPAGGFNITIKAAKAGTYAFGIQEPTRVKKLAAGEEWTVTWDSTLNIGDPVRLYNAHNVEELTVDSYYLANMRLEGMQHSTLGNSLKKLSIPKDCPISKISGLGNLTGLTYIDIDTESMEYIDFTQFPELKTLILKNWTPSIELKNINFDNLVIGGSMSVSIENCSATSGYVYGAGVDAGAHLYLTNSDSILEHMEEASELFKPNFATYDVTISNTIAIKTVPIDNGSGLYSNVLFYKLINNVEGNSIKGTFDISGLSEEDQTSIIKTCYANGLSYLYEGGGDAFIIKSVDLDKGVVTLSSTYLDSFASDAYITVSAVNTFGGSVPIELKSTNSNIYCYAEITKESDYVSKIQAKRGNAYGYLKLLGTDSDKMYRETFDVYSNGSVIDTISVILPTPDYYFNGSFAESIVASDTKYTTGAFCCVPYFPANGSGDGYIKVKSANGTSYAGSAFDSDIKVTSTGKTPSKYEGVVSIGGELVSFNFYGNGKTYSTTYSFTEFWRSNDVTITDDSSFPTNKNLFTKYPLQYLASGTYDGYSIATTSLIVTDATKKSNTFKNCRIVTGQGTHGFEGLTFEKSLIFASCGFGSGNTNTNCTFTNCNLYEFSTTRKLGSFSNCTFTNCKIYTHTPGTFFGSKNTFTNCEVYYNSDGSMTAPSGCVAYSTSGSDIVSAVKSASFDDLMADSSDDSGSSGGTNTAYTTIKYSGVIDSVSIAVSEGKTLFDFDDDCTCEVFITADPIDSEPIICVKGKNINLHIDNNLSTKLSSESVFIVNAIYLEGFIATEEYMAGTSKSSNYCDFNASYSGGWTGTAYCETAVALDSATDNKVDLYYTDYSACGGTQISELPSDDEIFAIFEQASY